ncbi:MAG: MFS transporter [Promethearchaeota archaeon]|jgi:MFS family permease
MNTTYQSERKRTFQSIFLLYFMMFFCSGILPVNIDNLLTYLPNTTKLGIGIINAGALIVGIISIISFGYYGDKISDKYSKKRVFIYTNLVWILTYGLASFSLNYYFYLAFLITGAIGTGAFLPLGFSMIGDLYSPKDRGKKYGAMQFSLVLGGGMGIVIGGLLGNYGGPSGWRFTYGLGFFLGILSLIFYTLSAIEPERLRSEPEFKDYAGEIKYTYKITYCNLKQLLRKKSIRAILIAVLLSGIANVTLGTWAIFYLNTKINGVDSELISTTIYILTGSGALPGTIIGGRIGDQYYKKGKLKARALISLLGLVFGILLMMIFYLVPFFTETTLQVIFSWIFFLIIGYMGFFFTSFAVGNQFAIYSEVSLPEVRSTTNAINGLMVNIGGIVGNLIISSSIEGNLSLLPFAILLVLVIWLFGSLFWIIPYYHYPRESKECKDILLERREEIDKI